MGVVVTSLVLLAHTVTVTLSDVGLARQRQGANSIANRTVEQARSIPHDTLRKGLKTSDLAGDPEIVSCDGVYRFRECSGEPIVHTAGLTDQAPLVPHRTTQTPPGSQSSFDVATYVTTTGTDPAADPLRVIVVVSWEQNFRAGVSDRVEVETIVYSPQGCVDTGTHPFAGPCRAFFFGTSSGPKGAIKIEGTINGTPITAILETVTARADGQLEQVDHVQGATGAAGMKVSTQSAGNEPVSSTADNDPATSGVHDYDTKTLTSGSGSTLQQSIGSLAVEVARSAGSTGETTSATSAGQPSDAGGTQTCPTTTPPGQQTDGAACGHNWAQQEGSLEARLLLDAISSLGTATVVSLAGSPGASAAQLDKDETSGGALTMSAVRSLGDLRIGGLPSGLSLGIPGGWQGYWIRLSPFQDNVSATVGEGTNAPSAAVSAGSVQIWNGTGYSTVPLGGTSPVDVSTTPLNLPNLPLLSNLADVTISGSVRTGAVSTQDPDGGASGAKRTQASAQSGSPIVADIDYRVVVRTVGVPPLIPSQELLDVTIKISVDLGALFAQGSYREASVA